MPSLLPQPSERARADLPAWLYITLGLLASGYIGWEYILQRGFLVHAVCTQGQIVDNWNTQRKGTSHYTAVFTFVDGGGKTRRVFEHDYRDKRVPTPVGQACTVVYDPDDPARAEIEAPDVLTDVFARAPIIGVFGGLFLIRGLLRWGYAWFQCPRKPPGDGDTPRNPTILAGP